METELKLLLATAAELQALRSVCGPTAHVLEQDSHYFDDPAGGWRAAGWSVRLRDQREAGRLRHLLTVKGPAPQIEGSSFLRRGEWERWIRSLGAAEIRPGGAKLGQEVAALLQTTDAPALPDILDPSALVPVGSLHNVRVAVPLPGDGPDLLLELDTTDYPDGETGWEAELELSDGMGAAEQDAAVSRLRSALQQAGVPWRPSTVTKLARFHAALRGLR